MVEESCVAFAYIIDGTIQLGYTYSKGSDITIYQLKFGPQWDKCMFDYLNMHEVIRT